MTKETLIDLNEGKHVVSVQAVQKDTEEPSAMASYLAPAAIVTKQDGTIMLTLVLEDHKTTTGFQIENVSGGLVEAIDKQVNEEANRRFEMFELDRFPTILPVRVQYEVEYGGRTMKGDEPLRLFFDEKTLEQIDESEIENN